MTEETESGGGEIEWVAKSTAIERDDPPDSRLEIDNVGETGIGDPIDDDGGKMPPQQLHRREGVDNVTQTAGFDHQNPVELRNHWRSITFGQSRRQSFGQTGLTDFGLGGGDIIRQAISGYH